MTQSDIASLIDHTLLRPDAVIGEIEKLCDEAREHQFCSVCINPYWVSTAKHRLEGSSVKVCTVVGFPLGATLPGVKAQEAHEAITKGADEIDMVLNIGAAKEAHWNFIEHEVHEIVSASKGRLVKVILETCLLCDTEIAEASKACERGGAHFVKTSTGFSKSGATVEAVRLMRKSVSASIGVKASGGVRDLASARAMIEAGANRLGTSNGVVIVQGLQAAAGTY
jgi:deoxyribose-phosphate aldolase